MFKRHGDAARLLIMFLTGFFEMHVVDFIAYYLSLSFVLGKVYLETFIRPRMFFFEFSILSFFLEKNSITLQKKTDITFPINTYSKTYLIITNKYLRPLLKTSSVIWTTTSSHISEQPGDINAALPEKTAYLHIF